VHTFNPSSAGAPFILGSNARGQLVTGLNADTVDGQHASAFATASHNHDTTYVRKGTADTITAVHTFNPSSAGAPFILGSNAQGQLVTGLNADTVDGQHGDAFVRKNTADTITAVHTFNPSTAGAPFILGANAQRNLVTGLNADMIDGMHADEIARNTVIDLSTTSEDYLLPPFSTAVINFNNATSVPLRVATTDNSHYELRIIPSTQSNATDADVFLYPNGQTYSNQFYGTGASFRYGYNAVTLRHSIVTSAFCIGHGIPVSIVWITNRLGFRKIIAYTGIYGSYDSNLPALFIVTCEWRNTTTPWTSLGSIVFPQSTSGTIIIQRLI
jgi:hypothetical protein